MENSIVAKLGEFAVWLWKPFGWALRMVARLIVWISTRFWARLRAMGAWRPLPWAARTVHAIGEWRVRSVAKVAVLAALVLVVGMVAGLAVMLYGSGPEVAMHAPESKIVYLDQNWGEGADSAARQTFYYTPQGTTLLGVPLRYAWLVNLERKPLFSVFSGKKEKLTDPANMRAMGFLVDNLPTEQNPDQLPVGFTKHYDPEIREDVLDLTCATCHTGQLNVRAKGGGTVALRIDGGPATHAFTSTSRGQFGTTLLASMGATLVNPFAFNRFARNVLGSQYPAGKGALRTELMDVTFRLASSAVRDKWRNLYPVEEGFGRLDAIARISNMVFATELDAKNYIQGDAPVSFPAIWDAPRFDWVQYTGSVAQPLARNMGESLGVGAVVGLTDAYGRPLAADRQFTSTSMIDNLVKIENTIKVLKQPQWPEEILGKIDRDKAARGKTLFVEHCAHCHTPCADTPSETKMYRPLRDPKDPFWHVNLVDVQDIGTDPQAALNFVNSKIDLTKAGIPRASLVAAAGRIYGEEKDRTLKLYPVASAAQLDCEIKQKIAAITPASTSIGQALNYMDILLSQLFFRNRGLDPANPAQAEAIENYEGEGALDDPQVKLVYKARPLGGVWATAPYLHNGSVPTVYEMLIPASQRTKKFFVSSQPEFDPVRVGLAASPDTTKGFWFDTTIAGNRNIGHEFRAGYVAWKEGDPPSNGIIGPELSDDDRWAIIEYLKILNDDQAPSCPAWQQPPPPVGCPK